MYLYGRQWTRRELTAHVGRLEQIGGIRRYLGDEGPERGMEFIQVRTGAGLTYTVTPTKGLDFSLAEYGGVPISWQSAGGDIHPMYYEPEEAGWLRTASGGLMMTCGLMNAGSPSVYEGKSYGLHGRVHHLPARQVCAEGVWQGDEYEMVIRGTVEETALFGGHLRMHREIRSRLGENKITVTDLVENAGSDPAPHMMLYHFNFGYPLLSPESTIQFPVGSVTPRDAAADLTGYDKWQEPEAGFQERVYYHGLEPAAKAEVRLFQPNFPQAGHRTVPLTAALSWSTDTLPQLVQWKMAGAGSYVLGIEPSNGLVGGIAEEAQQRRLLILQPGQSVRYNWELNIG